MCSYSKWQCSFSRGLGNCPAKQLRHLLSAHGNPGPLCCPNELCPSLHSLCSLPLPPPLHSTGNTQTDPSVLGGGPSVMKRPATAMMYRISCFQEVRETLLKQQLVSVCIRRTPGRNIKRYRVLDRDTHRRFFLEDNMSERNIHAH